MRTPRSTKETIRSLRSRSRARGAALVEAAVVLPVMAVFLGVMMFAHTAASVTMESQRVAGRDALYVASHGCSDGAAALPVGTDLAAAPSVPNAGDRDEAGKNAALDVRQMKATTTVTTTAAAHGYSRPVTVSATFHCNPKPYTESPYEWFDWGFATYRGGAR